MNVRVGTRARFVGKDNVFQDGEREGKVGTVILDANLDPNGSNFGAGFCFWGIDGESGMYLTAISDLEAV